MRHAFTVDFEDWYQGIPISSAIRRTVEQRLDRGTNILLDVLAQHGVRATFFLLGPVVEQHPALVRRIAEAGHELGCHGWSHDLLYQMTPKRFCEETRRAADVISNLTGQPVNAYRAAYFSITRRSFWALEILARLGFLFDSSIFPVRNWRYGIPDFEPCPQRIETPAGPIYELPISVRRIFGRNIPVSGGAYFRIYPYAISRNNFRALEAKRRQVVFYLHPWELDPGQPRIPFSFRPWMTHYFNLHSTEKKLHRLLKDFEFGTLSGVFGQELADSLNSLRSDCGGGGRLGGPPATHLDADR